MKEESFDALVEQVLGASLPEHLEATFSFPQLKPYAQDFIRRMLTLMKRSGYSASEFNPVLLHWASVIIPNVLPGVWGGRIPPITLPGRHKKLDDYVATLDITAGKEPNAFVDLGCGFPPLTAVDTARELPNWQVIGVDRSFTEYVLYDSHGNYACIDQAETMQYFQSGPSEKGLAIFGNPNAASEHFGDLFAELSPLLPKDADGKTSQTAEKDGNKLICHHLRDFETNNLTFVKAGLGELELPPAQVIRCMNVFVYFDLETRKQMLMQAGKLLADDGILIVGTNGIASESRITVYRKGSDGLYPDEFVFSLDNLGPFSLMPWFSIHEDDLDATLLAYLSRTLRADSLFWPDFSRRLDELLKEFALCERGPDGLLHFPDGFTLSAEFFGKSHHLWQQMEKEDFATGATKALERAGYHAWENAVGDVAVRPSTD